MPETIEMTDKENLGAIARHLIGINIKELTTAEKAICFILVKANILKMVKNEYETIFEM
jgi:hypothetical protein